MLDVLKSCLLERSKKMYEGIELEYIEEEEKMREDWKTRGGL